MRVNISRWVVIALVTMVWVSQAVAQDRPKTPEIPPKKTFKVEGHAAFVIMPTKIDEKTPVPWVWYAPTFPNLPEARENWMFEKFLAKGIAIAGVDVGESYGSPKGRAIYTAFHKELVTNRNFAPKAALLARSRGGLMLYNWAVENPESVACIAGIYPVCDLRSYPGLDKACGAYGLKRDELEAQLDKHNPVARLAPLAKAGVPIFHIHGDVDKTVPLKENSGEVAEQYKKLGGKMELKIAKDQGHNLWDGFFQCQELVDFVISHSVPAKKQGSARPIVIEKRAWSLCFSPDGTGLYLADFQSREIYYWDLVRNAQSHTIKIDNGFPGLLQLSPDGKVIYSRSLKNSFSAFDSQTGEEKKRFDEHKGSVKVLALSPDGKIVVSGDQENGLRVWDASSGKLLSTFRGTFLSTNPSPTGIAVSPDGKTIASTHRLRWNLDDLPLRIWRGSDGTEIMGLGRDCGEHDCLAFGKGGVLAAGGRDGVIRIWDLTTGKEKATLKGHDKVVNVIHFFDGGKRLISSSEDKTVRIWDVEKAKEVSQLTGHSEAINVMAISPTGNRLAMGSSEGKAVFLWDLEAMKPLETKRK